MPVTTRSQSKYSNVTIRVKCDEKKEKKEMKKVEEESVEKEEKKKDYEKEFSSNIKRLLDSVTSKTQRERVEIAIEVFKCVNAGIELMVRLQGIDVMMNFIEKTMNKMVQFHQVFEEGKLDNLGDVRLVRLLFHEMKEFKNIITKLLGTHFVKHFDLNI